MPYDIYRSSWTSPTSFYSIDSAFFLAAGLPVSFLGSGIDDVVTVSAVAFYLPSSAIAIALASATVKRSVTVGALE